MRDAPISQIVVGIGRFLGEIPRVDRGVRLYQGAVGAVTALYDKNGNRYALKVYAPGTKPQARTEHTALQQIRAGTDLPVPDPIVHGIAEGNDARPFLLMTYLPGHRWADQRDLLTATDRLMLATEAACLLRQLHMITGPRFGSLLQPDHDSAWAYLQHRYSVLTTDYLDCGGNTDIASRVQRLINGHRHEINTCQTAVLCHNDFIDGNLLIARQGGQQITGVVDLEAASWDDPLADLAKTARHLRYHDPAAAARLIEIYGATTPAAQARLAVHDALHAIHERTWITRDQPPGWREAVLSLDQHLEISSE